MNPTFVARGLRYASSRIGLQAHPRRIPRPSLRAVSTVSQAGPSSRPGQLPRDRRDAALVFEQSKISTVWDYTFETPVFQGDVSIPTGLFINGEFVEGANGEHIEVVNPTTGRAIAKVAAGTAEDVDTAVQAAQAAFDTTWGLNTPGSVRGNLLSNLAKLVEHHADTFAAIEALNNGKAFMAMRHIDVNYTIKVLQYYAGWADKLHGQTAETDDSRLAYTRHEPIGVVGQVVPWNAPLFMIALKIGPALATGNTIILKPSELTPLSSLFLSQLINEAGFAPGVVNIVNGLGRTVGQAMSEHPGIGKVAFTGSGGVGRRILETASKTNMKKVTLELGGKSPAVVFDDADINQAVTNTFHGMFSNQGQVCFATTRLYVQDGVYDEFLSKFTDQVKSIVVGDPFQPDTYQGPQISETQLNRVLDYIKIGVEEGATLHCGGRRIGGEGYFVEPTIFTDVENHMRIAREEIFGPVVCIFRFSDKEDVIRLANDTAYGLGAAVYSKDIPFAVKTANRMQAGMVWVNCLPAPSIQLPLGGYKESGIGRELSEYALEHYTNVKAVQVNLA